MKKQQKFQKKNFQKQINKNKSQINFLEFIDKHYKKIFYCIFIYGILVRILYFYQVSNNPSSNILLEHTDSWTYHNMALKILNGDLSGGQKVFYYNPGYAYFLAFVYYLFGINYNAVRILQTLLNIFTIPLGFFISLKIFNNKKLALLTTFFISSYGPLIYQTNLILIVGILPSFLIFFFYLFLKISEIKNIFYYLFVGILTSIIILLRPNFILFIPIFIFFIYIFHKKNKWIIFSLCYLLFVFISILPFTIHNYKNTGEFILITSNAGINFFIGNNPEADGVYSRPNILLKYSEELDKLKITSPTKQSKFWFNKSIEYIKNQPFHFLKLLLKKFLLFWWGKEIASNDDYEFEKQNNIILKNFVIDFNIVGPLAFIGILFLWRSKNIFIYQLYVFTLYYIFTIILFIVISRYKTPIVPILCIFAAFSFEEFIRFLSEKNYKRIILYLFLFICSYLIFNTYNFEIEPERNIFSYINEGIRYEKINDYQKALEMYNKALEIGKNYSPLRYNIGIIYYKLQNYEKALNEFLTAIKIDNKNKDAYFGAALCYEQLQDLANAIRYNELAIEHNLKREDVYNNLARLYAISGQLEKAEKIWGEMIINYPNYEPAKENFEKIKKLKQN